MIYVLLPAYNEEKGLPSVLKALIELRAQLEEDLRVVVVDDGSIDKTSEVAQSFDDLIPLHFITFPNNRGVKHVFREGFRYVCKHSESQETDVCVVLDSDNTQDPNLIPKMRELIGSGKEDVVIASRFEQGGKMIGCPWVRRMYSYAVSWLMQLLIGLKNVRDYSTFYRMYRVSLLSRGFEAYGDSLIEGKGFSVAASMLIKLGNLTDRLCEIPFVLRYDLKEGGSGINLQKTIAGYVTLLCEYWTSGRFDSKRVREQFGRNVSRV